MFKWYAYQTLLPLMLGLLGLAAWLFYTLRIATSPLIPVVVLQDRTTAITYCATMIQGLGVSTSNRT